MKKKSQHEVKDEERAKRDIAAQAHPFLAFEFDSNCQALGGLAVRVEFKCFVSAPFSIVSTLLSIVFGAIFDRFQFFFGLFSIVFCSFLVRFKAWMPFARCPMTLLQSLSSHPGQPQRMQNSRSSSATR